LFQRLGGQRELRRLRGVLRRAAFREKKGTSLNKPAQSLKEPAQSLKYHRTTWRKGGQNLPLQVCALIA
jgi:hypothetical protein